MRAGLLTRLATLERQVNPEAVLRETRGLAALLRSAEQHPPQPWEEDDADAEPSGLGPLLHEARCWLAQQREAGEPS
jgi:hypothetical protein